MFSDPKVDDGEYIKNAPVLPPPATMAFSKSTAQVETDWH